MENTQERPRDRKLTVGITHGDFNGISYEIIIKTFLEPKILELFTPVVYGSSKIASYHRKTLNINDFSFNVIRKPDQANPKRPNIINLTENEVKIDLGESTETAGELAYMALEMAAEDLRNHQIDVLVTAPINKQNIQSKGFNFPGHTEYFARKFDCKDYLMLMVHEKLRVGVATGHVPLQQVPGLLTPELIQKKINVIDNSLKLDFGITRPRIAVLALNPHAGDGGLLGNEEENIILPAINRAKDAGMLVFGPYPADGFFGSGMFSRFDGVLAMYHDQGMVPFKTLFSEEGVNFTAGLPYVRTSPAHGTAYDIAGKDLASADSFRMALYLACDIYKNRIMEEDLGKNRLDIRISEAE